MDPRQPIAINSYFCEPARCVVAMAASVGGLNGLSVILGALPADFPAAIAIVMHLSPDHKSLLADKQAQPGDRAGDQSEQQRREGDHQQPPQQVRPGRGHTQA